MISYLLPWSIYSDEVPSEGNVLFKISTRSKTNALATIMIFRTAYLVAMIASCSIIPDHNPGDDVLRFDMRLDNPSAIASWTLKNINNTTQCFCLQGHACDNSSDKTSSVKYNGDDCAIQTVTESLWISNQIWKSILIPFTKWDAARFLNLAVNPSLRDPIYSQSTDTSEQAHAFLPMFPWIIRNFALALFRILPTYILPPTFESLVVLTGVILNNFICLPICILTLYELTCQILNRRKRKSQNKVNHARGDFRNSLESQRVAIAVCLVFGIWNPASVFFATNYSESFFMMTTLVGHLFIEWGKMCIPQNIQQYEQASKLFDWFHSIWWWSTGIGCWMIGSYTRSNGTLHCLWILHDGLSTLIYNFHEQKRSNQSIFSLRAMLGHILVALKTMLGIFLVALPVRFHDWQGYQRHCYDDATVRPQWCINSGIIASINEDWLSSMFSTSFSLYRFVQDKHWNVGLFRYYTWNQVPNFTLATPILSLSILGAFLWITWSLKNDYGKGKIPNKLRLIVLGWPLYALRNSVTGDDYHVTDSTKKLSYSFRDRLLENPQLLGHYAILSILALLGLLVAHVQISTRMICSTSPAIYWFITYCILAPSNDTETKTNASSYNFDSQHKPSRLGKVVLLYTVLYMLLGIIMHVNFLPWT